MKKNLTWKRGTRLRCISEYWSFCHGSCFKFGGGATRLDAPTIAWGKQALLRTVLTFYGALGKIFLEIVTNRTTSTRHYWNVESWMWPKFRINAIKIYHLNLSIMKKIELHLLCADSSEALCYPISGWCSQTHQRRHVTSDLRTVCDDKHALIISRLVH